jgi:MoaA/NifB/PqqE/SkfB family radical SAM enzyme
MAVVAAVPVTRAITEGSRRILTFVVPAPNGCDLDCSFCFIRARGEQRPGAPFLSVDQYVDFARAVAKREALSVLAIQGYEALLPESWPYTDALLSFARDAGIEAALVTNGTHLEARADELASLGLSSLTVSLDSADAALHDEARGTAGAFVRTLAGLRKVASHDLLQSRTLVASVMQPRRHEALVGIPDLLAQLGLTTWIVQPTFKVGSSEGRLVEDTEALVPSLVRLNALAQSKGVRMVVEDELGVLMRAGFPLGSTAHVETFEVRKINALERVVRLSPNGDVAVGTSALLKVSHRLRPVWLPGSESAARFVDRALRATGHRASA